MTENIPRMMTVRQVARTGLLSEHALRLMLKAGKLPAIFVGNKALINYDRLCEQLATLGADLTKEPAEFFICAAGSPIGGRRLLGHFTILSCRPFPKQPDMHPLQFLHGVRLFVGHPATSLLFPLRQVARTGLLS